MKLTRFVDLAFKPFFRRIKAGAKTGFPRFRSADPADRLGNWYACFSCVVEPEHLEPTHEVVGIDLGLTKFMVLSDGEIVERQCWMKRI